MPTDTAFINSQINIREVAEKAGAEFKGNQSRCIIHNGDNPTAFSIFDDGRAWKCWTHESECNAGGHDGIALLMALNGWTFKQVCERYNRPLDPQEAARRAVENAKQAERDLKAQIERAQKALTELQTARKWLEYHDNMGDGARELWRERGVADSWQDYYKFGYDISFGYSYAHEFYTSPTLTIPLFGIKQIEPCNVKHRLLDPIEPKSKYRYEKQDLPAAPFYGEIDLAVADAERVVIVEGEIKAAVTMQTIYGAPMLQVIGMPSKNQRKRLWPELAAQLHGHDVWMFPDPDDHQDSEEFAGMIGGARIIRLPFKIDDMIVDGLLSKADILGMMTQARRKVV